MPGPPIIMPKSGCAFCAKPWLRLPETWKASLLFWPSTGAAVGAAVSGAFNSLCNCVSN